MRGGSPVAQGYLRKIGLGQRTRKGFTGGYGYTDQPVDTTPTRMSSFYKKGGRVKLAKRGLGRAFTKSKK